jgi:hypothetical protein
MAENGEVAPGYKTDEGKVRLDLVSPHAIWAMGEVLTAGLAAGYPERNWEKGMAWHRMYGAAMRHLQRWWGGEDIDPQSGISHLSHALFSIAALVHYDIECTGEDDRPMLEERVDQSTPRDEEEEGHRESYLNYLPTVDWDAEEKGNREFNMESLSETLKKFANMKAGGNEAEGWLNISKAQKLKPNPKLSINFEAKDIPPVDFDACDQEAAEPTGD